MDVPVWSTRRHDWFKTLYLFIDAWHRFGFHGPFAKYCLYLCSFYFSVKSAKFTLLFFL